jgi:hypothetical protein
VVAAALVVIVYTTRPQPKPPAPPFVGRCDRLAIVDLRLSGGGKATELQRQSGAAGWRLLQPVDAAADPDRVDQLVGELAAIKPLNTLSRPGDPHQYGLAPPRLTVTCRVEDGGSYTLSIGDQSFDQSGWYASKLDGKVYVVPGSAVDQFDRSLTDPPVRATPSPGLSPSP